MLSLAVLLDLIDDQEDRNKFDVLMNKYWKDAWYVANRVLNDKHLAEDIVQDTFEIVARKIKTINTDIPRKTKSYITTIAEHLAYDKLEERNNTIIFSVEDIIEDNYSISIDIESLLMDSSRRDDVLSAARSLDKFYSTPLLLYFDNLPHKEIAEILKISENAARQRVHRAKIKVLKILGEE